MKKVYILLLALTALCACNPMEDIYDELDGLKQPLSKQFDYIMEDADYKTASDAALKYAETAKDSSNVKGIATNKNFSAKAPAKKYMPYFLATKFPALGKKSSVNVTYKFYDSANRKTVEQSDQFIHTGEAWVFDPSVSYTMTKADYQLVVDEVIAMGAEMEDYLYYKKNQDYYYGANAYYGQFDIKLTTRKANDKQGLLFVGKDGKPMSDDAAAKVIQEKIQEGIIIFLKKKFPDAQPIVDGAEMYYHITYSVRDAANVDNMVTYQCTAPGEFKLTEGPVEI